MITDMNAPVGPGLVLRVDNTDYAGWLAINVKRNIEAGAADFALEVSERWPGRAEPWHITPGAACSVWLDGLLVITGYVDVYSPHFDATTHRVTVRGRSKTADFSDASAVMDGGQMNGLTVGDIAERLAKPFGITIVRQADSDPLPEVQLQQGEAGYATVERLCRMSGLLVSDDAQGHLVIAKPGAARGSGKLEQGKNLLTAEADLDYSQRFSVVIVKSQQSNKDDRTEPVDDTGDGDGEPPARAGRSPTARGADTGPIDFPDEASAGGDSTVSYSGQATDDAIKRYRPLIIFAENLANAAQAQQRAENEVRRRIGQALQARATVQGWKQPDGTLWTAGQVIPVTSPWLGIDKEMIIKETNFSLDDQGTRTQLSLTLVDAYIPTADETDQASKPASGQDKDTKEAFWAP